MNLDLVNDQLSRAEVAEQEFLRDHYLKKFRGMRKEYFDVDLNIKPDILQKIKEASKLRSLQLPDNLSEVFLSMEESHAFWLLKTPLYIYLEDFFKQYYSKSTAFELFKSPEEYYQKWVLNKSVADKKFYAGYLVNLSEKIDPNNFYYQFLVSAVYSNEKSLLNFDRSIDALEKARTAIMHHDLNDSFREQFLYLIDLFSGFNYLQKDNINAAYEKIDSASGINPLSIAAKFYKALLELKLSRKEGSYFLVNEILNFDYSRCLHAVSNSDLEMLVYFIRHPVIINIFHYDIFAALADLIENELGHIKQMHKNNHDDLIGKLKKLEELQIEELYDDKFLKITGFLSQVLTSKGSNKNSVLFLYIYPALLEEFSKAINHLKYLIREKFNNEIRLELSVFNSKIEDKLKHIDKIKKEQLISIQNLKDNLKSSIQNAELLTAESITDIEDRINNINSAAKLSPGRTFSRSMAYNFVLSSLVFLMGGCAGYTDTFMYGVRELKEIVGVVFISGMKWGGLSFLGGILISTIAAGYIIMERTNERQKLIKVISSLKQRKEKEISILNKNYNTAEKTSLYNFTKLINIQEEELKILLEAKQQKEFFLNKETEEKIMDENAKLDQLLY